MLILSLTQGMNVRGEHQVGGKWPVLTDKQTYRAKGHERERSHIALVPIAAEAEVPLTVSAEPGWFGK